MPALLIMSIASLVLFGDVPFDTKFWRLLFNYGHTPAFGLAAITMARVISILLPTLSRSRQYFLAGGLVWALGVFVELAQAVIGRDAELEDVARNSLGIVGVLGLVALWEKSSPIRAGVSRQYRATVSIVVICLLLLPALPVAGWVAVMITRHLQLPVLVDFSSYSGRALCLTRDARLRIVSAPGAWPERSGDKVAEITFVASPDEDYPQFEIVEPHPDWSVYRELVIPVFNPAQVPLRLRVRTDDWWHNQLPQDRYTGQFRVPPGASTLVIPLDSIRFAPQGRQTDLTRMRNILLFLYRPGTTMTLYVGDITLH